MNAQKPDEDALVEWLFRAYAGTREIHDMTPGDEPTAPRFLVAVNERARAARLLKREHTVLLHLWVVPPELWEAALAGGRSLPDGFASVPARTWKREAASGDAVTQVNNVALMNFRRFEQQGLSFSPGMNVLVGQNGAGKTSVLDALATGLAEVVRPLHPGTGDPLSGWRLREQDVRRAPIVTGELLTFEPQFPAGIDVQMLVFDERIVCGPLVQQSESGAVFGGPGRAVPFLEITDVVRWAVQDGFDVTLPLIVYYGTNRAWRGEKERASTRETLSRLAGYEGCLSPSVDLSGMRAWFRRMELLALQDQRTPAVLEASKAAIVGCLDGFDLVRYDARLEDLAARFTATGLLLGFEQLSDGQRNMLGMIADMAYRAATLNPHLGKDVLERTPGVVLIDELDLHLHPRLQRRIVKDLKRVFPSIQFICTTHSPQIIGEVTRDEVYLLRDEGFVRPPVALGADSNWILKHVMEGATAETVHARELQDAAEDALIEGDLVMARDKLEQFRRLLEGETGELARLEGSLGSLEALARRPCCMPSKMACTTSKAASAHTRGGESL